MILSIERFNRKRVLLLIDKNIERKKFNAFEKIIILHKKRGWGRVSMRPLPVAVAHVDSV